MSEAIKHECGLALVRLRKPLNYYRDRYNTPLWGFHKLFLLMEKQHNRGQDGAGLGSLKLRMPPGEPYLARQREIKKNPLDAMFKGLLKDLNKQARNGHIDLTDGDSVKKNFDFGGEVLIGHLRYATSGSYQRRSCHPYVRRSSWASRALMLAGNFNLTNSDELNDRLIEKGHHPLFDTDTQAILEELGCNLDELHDDVRLKLAQESRLTGPEFANRIADELDPAEMMRRSARHWDGGYALAGMLGSGDCFAVRDPSGIRPLHYAINDEVLAIASERAPLMTVFDLEKEEVHEVEPGSAIVMKGNGRFYTSRFAEMRDRRPCAFERIYFSRGNDPEIYQERKALGGALTEQIMKEIGGDLTNTVFSFIPNTAEVAYFGLMDEMRIRRRRQVRDEILQAQLQGHLTPEMLDSLIMGSWPRAEKVAIKDQKLRTFISEEKMRNQLASHVYDISYGSCEPGSNLVCIDDSIVRGTTLKRSIVKILSRLNPKKIIIASTAPQIRYPDCYGIDMSQLGKFIAFQAAEELLKETGQEGLLYEVYFRCVQQKVARPKVMENFVKLIYEPFAYEEISRRIGQIVSAGDTENDDWKGELSIVYQTIEDLHRALPNHRGDWYFTGDYPTPGGYRVVNQAYINYYEKRHHARSY